jgi:hypothetical protein
MKKWTRSNFHVFRKKRGVIAEEILQTIGEGTKQ